MKRFLLFVGEHHYPAGGYRDYVGCYATPGEAMLAIEGKIGADISLLDWAHIVEICEPDGLQLVMSKWKDEPWETPPFGSTAAQQLLMNQKRACTRQLNRR